MEEILLQQDSNAALLQQAITNYKKTPSDRKTVEYIKRKLTEITKLWQQFDDLDKKIRNNPMVLADHAYVKGNFYDGVREKYDAVLSKILGELSIAEENHRKASSTTPLVTPRGSNATEAAGSSGTSSQGSSQAQHSQDVTSLLWHKQRKGIEAVKKMLRQMFDDQDSLSAQFQQLKLRTVEQHWKSVQQLHEQLWTSTYEYDLDEYLKLENEINESILTYQERINEPSVVNATQQRNTFFARSDVKLPNIELPSFDGRYTQWRQFRDLFEEMVHKQPLSACQKMWYLKSSITGEASKLIQHFTTSSDHYEAAWQVINNRYENKRLLVSALLQKLLSQQQVQRESAATLKAMHDTTKECLLGLQGLGLQTQDWDPIIVHILLQLVDRQTHMQWEQALANPRDVPKLEEFLNFLELRFQSIEALGSTRKASQSSSLTLLTTTNACVACKQNHGLFQCAKFLNMSVKQRLQLVQGARCCVNCMKAGHKTQQCPSTKTCNKCGKAHNTLLHLDLNIVSSKFKPSPNKPRSGFVEQASSSVVPLQSENKSPSASLVAFPTKRSPAALLSTVLITIDDVNGQPVECRAVLDNGSQINFVTTSLVKKLGLATWDHKLDIHGIGQTRSKATARVNIRLASRTTEFYSRLEAQVLPKIVSQQPAHYFDVTNWNLPKNIQLADPGFNTPNKIDVLIGAGLFYSILSVGQIELGNNLPLLQNTVFGWVVAGEFSESDTALSVTCGVCSNEELMESMKTFWELEECLTPSREMTATEIKCEQHFAKTHRRAADSRFTVKLPFFERVESLGQSYEIALQRLRSGEKRLSKNEDLKKQYVAFMQEYQRLGHMEEILMKEIKGPHYFLPHHAVLKPESTTTKLRVVFDGSAKTSSNLSLNDILAIGPTIQDDVFTQILRFRVPRYVFTADIEKMYRQIWVHKDDRNFQLILWRENVDQAVKVFQLKTITYGTSCAPYLAIRCLQQLAEDGESKYPLAYQILKKNFYVDDVLTGADDVTTAIERMNHYANC